MDPADHGEGERGRGETEDKVDDAEMTSIVESAADSGAGVGSGEGATTGGGSGGRRGGTFGGDDYDEVEHWQRIRECRGHGIDAVGLAWAPDDSHLVSCSLDSRT